MVATPKSECVDFIRFIQSYFVIRVCGKAKGLSECIECIDSVGVPVGCSVCTVASVAGLGGWPYSTYQRHTPEPVRELFSCGGAGERTLLWSG